MNFQRIILSYAVIAFVIGTSSAQYLPGARQIALSHSDIAYQKDVFASFNNPAGLTNINSTQIGIYYSPSPFGLKQLSNGFGGISGNLKFCSLAFGFSTYGFELYKENKISFSFAKKITGNFYAGLTAFYHSLSIRNYGSDNTLSFTLGTVVLLTQDLFLGFTAANITRSTYGNNANQIPSVFKTGLSYKIESQFVIHCAFEKEIDNPLSLRFGIEYRPIQHIDLRLGFMNEPNLFSSGIGINFLYFNVDYALFTHQDLGLTHQAGLIITF